MTNEKKNMEDLDDREDGTTIKVSQETDSAEQARKEPDQAIKEMEEKLQKVEDEAKESYDRMLRVSAEFENYKKRNMREMNEFRKFANESLIKELLPIVDNLERAIILSDSDSQINNSILEGVNLTLKDILKVLENFSVKPIDVVGKDFDPGFHEAVYQEETDDYPENTVIKELQRGYMIHDRLLRPAMVAVSKPEAK
ncbi:MAG: nucleotide exchange factor GrpE [Desulfobacterales bacterium]|nr:nucleotide exchange factor GrpE [Desulfobacterales bacterium]